jgi:hypothetical protein
VARELAERNRLIPVLTVEDCDREETDQCRSHGGGGVHEE